MRQSIKTGVLERRAERKALYALIATCEKENIIKALEIIKADKNHSRAARHYYKPFYFNIQKSFDDIITFTHFTNTRALNFLAFHYLRGTLDDIATLIKKIKHQQLSIDFVSSEMTDDFFKLIGIAACEHLAKQNKIHALPNLRIESLYLSPITKHENFNAVPIDARHFVQLTSISLDKDAQYLQFFDPRKLKALKTLILNDVKLSDVVYFIKALPNLEELKCYFNNYEGWEQLKSNSLTSLTLSVRKFNTDTRDSLPDFSINIPNLSYLNLECIYIPNTDNLVKLKKLKQLIFTQGNYGKEKFVIPPLPLLYHLHLWRITNLDLAAISQISSLTQLKMCYCNLTDISFLATLSNLKDLDISRNEISDISSLSLLKDLVFLKVMQNKISNIAALSQLEDLYELDIRYNAVTDISDLELSKSLGSLHLQGNTLAVYPPLRAMIPIGVHDIKEAVRNLEEPQEVTSFRALIRSNDKNNMAIAEQILLGRGWTQSEFEKFVYILRYN